MLHRKPTRIELKQVDCATIGADEAHRAAHDLVARTAAEDIGQRRLARPIGPHDRMHFARANAKREAIENALAVDFGA